jgi:hypothetical protein
MKPTKTVDLIDIKKKKKVRIFCMKNKNKKIKFCFVVFFYLNSNKK